MNRHLKNNCKFITNTDDEKERLFQQLLRQNNMVINENNQLKQEVNIVNNNIQTNIYTNLVAFGKEDMSFIVDEITKKILNKGFMSVPVLTKYTHFNKDRPEFHNVYISNMRNNYVMVFDGNKWNLKDSKFILDDMINGKADYLIEQFDQFKDELDESTLKKFGRFMNQQHEDDVINMITNELKLILYNNREIPLETRKKIGLLTLEDND